MIMTLILTAGLLACMALLASEYGGAGEAPGPVDADQAFYDGDTLVANTASTVIDLGGGFTPHPDVPMAVLLHVTALDTDDGDGAYTFKVQTRAASTDDWADTGLVITVSSTGQVRKVVGIRQRYVRLLPVITETTPSITLSAWLTPA